MQTKTTLQRGSRLLGGGCHADPWGEVRANAQVHCHGAIHLSDGIGLPDRRFDHLLDANSLLFP